MKPLDMAVAILAAAILLGVGYRLRGDVVRINGLVAEPAPPIVRAGKYQAWNCIYQREPRAMKAQRSRGAWVQRSRRQ